MNRNKELLQDYLYDLKEQSRQLARSVERMQMQIAIMAHENKADYEHQEVDSESK